LKTIRIAEETHTELTKVKGELTRRNGKSKSYDQTIMELIDSWQKREI
jgi:predicted CopG family antitoxin